MKGGVSQVIILCMVRHQQCLLTALDAAAMADVQPADGSFLCHAISGGQCHGQPAGGEEGGCQGEMELGDGEQVVKQGRVRRVNI